MTAPDPDDSAHEEMMLHAAILGRWNASSWVGWQVESDRSKQMENVIAVDPDKYREMELMIERQEAKIGNLRRELEVTEMILEERTRLLYAIPECPVHGRDCVPHAIDWVDSIRTERAELRAALKPFVDAYKNYAKVYPSEFYMTDNPPAYLTRLSHFEQAARVLDKDGAIGG